MEQIVVSVREASGVAEARRSTVALTAPLRWNETASGTLALAVTEAATNLVKHGRGGDIIARPISVNDRSGIEVLAIDSGPGIASVADSMRDGHSTSGSPGLGLGSLSRLTTNLEVFSSPGKGTALRFEVWAGGRPDAPPPQIDIGVVSIALEGQLVCGDAWGLHSARDHHVAIAVDGLGHGPEAATAAHTALRTWTERPMLPLGEQMHRLHAALRPTRGAAGSLAALSPARETGSFCGVGNVSGVTRLAGRSRSLVSHNGTLGHQMRKVQEFDFPFPRDALLILHTDGISTSWNLDQYRGIESRHPALVAAVLYRDFRRESDDATVFVMRNCQRRA